MAQPPSGTISTLIWKAGNMESEYYVDFLRDILSLDEAVRTEASNRVQDFVNLLSGTQARVVGDLIAMLAPREESRVALEALLHALSDLDGCGKLEGVDLSPLGEIPESMIHVEHRVYMDAFAELIAETSNGTSE
ncbi:hypothetical protein [Streptomyces goshikiensis]|uniref:hypothetical protein n=1 Tax=Streptomyces goshikiensis TaxID=1942 RepID=UPI002E142E67|nr:hypothetical protein OG224_30730 [Streptomyces goshikiensis]